MSKVTRRKTDAHRISLLLGALFVPFPSLLVFAGSVQQSQDFINGTTSQQVAALAARIDRIENMIYAVFVAMMINFAAQIVQIRRSTNGRKEE